MAALSLASSTRNRVVPKLCRSMASTSSTPLPSARYLQRSGVQDGVDTATHETPRNLTQAQKEMLHSSIRIDQAGEVAANWIYKGQLAILGNDPKTGPVIEVRQLLYSMNLNCGYSKSSDMLLFRPTGNVGTREETSSCDGPTADTA